MRLDAGVVCAVMLASALAVAGCRSSHLELPEVQGSPAMVDDGGKMRLWVLIKQEDVRQVGVGGGATRKTSSWRSDTFFHFEIRAFDPLTARPLWKQRLLTLGDADASGSGPSRVIGSSVDARLLGQDGDSVWLLVGNAPMAVSASDGRVIADVDRIGEANLGLRELLPADAGQYGFDRGLVLLAADARRLVIRGALLQAVDYVPTPVAGRGGVPAVAPSASHARRPGFIAYRPSSLRPDCQGATEANYLPSAFTASRVCLTCWLGLSAE